MNTVYHRVPHAGLLRIGAAACLASHSQAAAVAAAPAGDALAMTWSVGCKHGWQLYPGSHRETSCRRRRCSQTCRRYVAGSNLHAATTRQVYARSGRKRRQEIDGGLQSTRRHHPSGLCTQRSGRSGRKWWGGSGHSLQPRKERSSNMSPPAHQKQSALAMAQLRACPDSSIICWCATASSLATGGTDSHTSPENRR